MSSKTDNEERSNERREIFGPLIVIPRAEHEDVEESYRALKKAKYISSRISSGRRRLNWS